MIRFIRPFLPPPSAWLGYLQPAYDAAWFSNFGTVHEQFALALTQQFGGTTRSAMPISSATAGLSATLMALGIQGTVAMPAFTFAATAHAALGAGCVPRFCDIDAQTWSLSAVELDRVLTQETVSAVMSVRPFGFAQDFSDIESICRQHGVPLILDSAAALGGCLPDGTTIGRQGTAEIFSLHATKVFAIGEGGVVFCDPELAHAIRRTINFGFTGNAATHAGLNGKMSEFQAAVGLAMLDRFPDHLANRRRYAAKLATLLAPLRARNLIELHPSPGLAPFQTLPVVLAEHLDAAAVVSRAAALGLELRRYYYPLLSDMPAFAAYTRADGLPVSRKLSPRLVCLPVYSEMADELIETIAGIFARSLAA